MVWQLCKLLYTCYLLTVTYLCIQSYDVVQCFRNLADIDGDGRLVPDEFIVALHYVAIAKSGKPVPANLPADIMPPSYRNRQKPSSESPAEKPPASLPRPTSRPPAGVTKVPAIQPPSSGAAKSQPGAATETASGTDPFGMKPAVFDATAAPAPAAAVEAQQETTSDKMSPPTDVPPASNSAAEPSSTAVNEGMQHQ